jgi:radical SAM superfamily enzyme YgiQ (UPF0313 family)
MDILFVNPGCDLEKAAGELENFLLPMPPIGLACLAAYLEQSGYSVGIYDDFLNKSNDRKLMARVRQDRPLIIGMPLFTSNLVYRAQKIMEIVKANNPEVKIVLGNIHASVFRHDLTRNPLVDFIIIGEGELTLAELVQTIKNGGTSYGQIPGLAYVDREGQYVETAQRPLMKDLDMLPFPAWHLLPILKYELFPFGKVKAPATLISGSRGCPYRCSFCSLVVHGSVRRVRSVKNIVDEMEYVHAMYGINQFGFVDPIFPISAKEGLAFCAEMIKRGLHKKIVWISETRIDCVTQELLTMMGKAGCARVMFGLETSAQKNIDSMHKQFLAGKAQEVIKWCRKAKVGSLGFFIIGLPGETQQDIERTILYAREIGLDYAKFSVFTPYPGTSVFTELQEDPNFDKKRINDWNSYTLYPTEENPPIYINKAVGIKTLIGLHRKAHILFYSRPRQIFLLLKHLNFQDYFRIAFYLFKQFGLFITKIPEAAGRFFISNISKT